MDLYDIVMLVGVSLVSLLGLAMCLFPDRMLRKKYRDNQAVTKEYREKGLAVFLAGLLCIVVVLIIRTK